MSAKKPDKSNENTNSPRTNDEIIDAYDYLSNAASMQDMTGLIPSEPVSADELKSYEELFHFLPPNSDVENIDVPNSNTHNKKNESPS